MQKAVQSHGRPREFDRYEALQTALRLFRRHGYEGVSISELTKAMNISPPSLYAAFGSKEALYREVLALYQKRYLVEALEQNGPISDRVFAMLRETVGIALDPDYPGGCMVMAGMLNCGPKQMALAETVRKLRTSRCQIIAEHLGQAVKRGELPEDADVQAISRYLAALIQGISIQAYDGATATELFAMIKVALRDWPRNQVTAAPS